MSLLKVNSNDLSLPWECNDQSFNGYYYMVTIKNNTSPKKLYTMPDRYTQQANRLLLKGFHHVKSAFELDSKLQLHLHMIVRSDKNVHRVKTSQFLKQYEPTFVHDIKPIESLNHLYNAYNYLEPKYNQQVLGRYQYEWFDNDACDFIDTSADNIRYAFEAFKNGK